VGCPGEGAARGEATVGRGLAAAEATATGRGARARACAGPAPAPARRVEMVSRHTRVAPAASATRRAETASFCAATTAGRRAPAPPRPPPVAAPAPPPPASAPVVIQFERPLDEDAEEIGAGPGGTLTPDEVAAVECLPAEFPCDACYKGDTQPFLRYAPIDRGSRLLECATEVARLFLAQSDLIEPTRRSHAGLYFPQGIHRVIKEVGPRGGPKRPARVGEGVAHFGPLKRAHAREGSSAKHKVYWRKLDLALDDALEELMAAVRDVWPEDVGAELDEIQGLRCAIEPGGRALPTAATFSIGLSNRWHRDAGDMTTGAQSWTTVVAIDLARLAAIDLEVQVRAPPAQRRRGKRSGRGEPIYKVEYDAYVRDRFQSHVGEAALDDPPPPVGTPGGPD